MRNRAEISLSNQTFGDVTAWRGIRSAGKNTIVEFHVPVEQPKPVNRIAELNEELRRFNNLRGTDLTPQQKSQLEFLQKQNRNKLFEEMKIVGHKPIRTKNNHI
jgi:hypothetical protein